MKSLWHKNWWQSLESKMWILDIKTTEFTIITGWWLTYPSEKWWTSSVGIMTFPIWWESHKIPWFQSPPTRLSRLWLTDRQVWRLTLPEIHVLADFVDPGGDKVWGVDRTVQQESKVRKYQTRACELTNIWVLGLGSMFNLKLRISIYVHLGNSYSIKNYVLMNDIPRCWQFRFRNQDRRTAARNFPWSSPYGSV